MAMCQCELHLGYMTLGQGHDTLFGHGQYLGEILSKSKMTEVSYDPDKRFSYVRTVTLTSEV